MRKYFTSLTTLFVALVLATGSAGCKKSADNPGDFDESEASYEQPGPNPQTDLESSVNGDPVVFDTAVAFRRGSSAIHLAFSTEHRSCGELFELLEALEDADVGSSSAAEEIVFWVDLMQPLPPREVGELVVRATRFGHLTEDRPSGFAEMSEVDTNPGSHTRGQLDLSRHGVTVAGSFDAVGCGDFLPTGIAPRPQDVLAIFEGQQLEFQGATVRGGSGNPILVLTTSPHDCAQVPESDLHLELSLGGVAGDRVEVLSVTVAGARRIRPAILDASERELFSMTALGPQTSSEATFGISHNLNVRGSLFRLEGTIVATRCD